MDTWNIVQMQHLCDISFHALNAPEVWKVVQFLLQDMIGLQISHFQIESQEQKKMIGQNITSF